MTGSQVGQSSSSGQWSFVISRRSLDRRVILLARLIISFAYQEAAANHLSDESSVVTCRLQDYRLLSVAMTKSLRGSSRCIVLAESYCYLMSRSAVI